MEAFTMFNPLAIAQKAMQGGGSFTLSLPQAPESYERIRSGDRESFLRLGANGEAVKALKEHIIAANNALVAKGELPILTVETLMSSEFNNAKSDFTHFGTETERALKAIQNRFSITLDGKAVEKRNGLYIDGVAGTWTVTALDLLAGNTINFQTRTEALRQINGGRFVDDINYATKPTSRSYSMPSVKTTSVTVDEACAIGSTQASQELARVIESRIPSNKPQGGWCMRAVREAIEECALLGWHHRVPPRAKEGFKLLQGDDQFCQVTGSGADGALTRVELDRIQGLTGAIVYMKNPLHPNRAGHICVLTGNGGAISDIRQQEANPYRHTVDRYYVLLPIGDRDLSRELAWSSSRS